MILGLKIRKSDLHRIRFCSIPVIDPYFSKVACHNPSCAFTERQVIIVHLCLLVWGHSIVTGLWLIKSNTAAFLFDQNVSLRDIHINSLRISIAADHFLFEVKPLRDIFHTKNIRQYFNPERPGILVFFALIFPSIIELSCCFSLLRISHGSLYLTR